MGELDPGKVDLDGMLPSVCSMLLMQLLLGVAIQYVVQRLQTWPEENFEGNYFEEHPTLNDEGHYAYAANLSEDRASYEQRIWHICQKRLVFDPGGKEEPFRCDY